MCHQSFLIDSHAHSARVDPESFSLKLSPSDGLCAVRERLHCNNYGVCFSLFLFAKRRFLERYHPLVLCVCCFPRVHCVSNNYNNSYYRAATQRETAAANYNFVFVQIECSRLIQPASSIYHPAALQNKSKSPDK